MEDDFKHLVRISRKDVDGNKTIEQALTEIKGVGISLSTTMCRTLDLDSEAQIGYIADEDVLKIEEILEKFYKIEMTDDLYFKIKNGSIIKNNYNHDIVAFTKNDKVIAIYKEYSKDRTLLKPWKMFL